jgi:hypothetical protein
MEARRVELLSENPLAKTSPITFGFGDFPAAAETDKFRRR